jgi:hypothetical protein
MIKIVLTEEEVRKAERVAESRQSENLKNARSDRYGADPRDGIRLHKIGAKGELAVAKWLGRDWDGNLNDFSAADVGDYQVRTTKYDRGSLILHPADNDRDIFFLVINGDPEYKIAGWIRATDGKEDRYWKDLSGDGRHAYFVPQRALRDPTTFEEDIR